MIERLANWRTFFVLLAIDLAFTILFNVYGRHYPDPAFDGRVSGFRPSEVEPILRSFALAPARRFRIRWRCSPASCSG